MTIEAIGVGIIAGVIVVVPQAVSFIFPNAPWTSPFLILGVGVLGLFLYQGWGSRRSSDLRNFGFADLLVYIHSPLSQESSLQWFARSSISFLFALCGGIVGSEGASIEFLQGIHLRFRSAATRWFEQRRRTQVGCIIAASVAAVFGAPFAAFLIPMEWGIGGRSLSIFLSSLIAFVTVKVTQSVFHLPALGWRETFAGVQFLEWKAWVGLLILALIGGLLGVITLAFSRYASMSFSALFRNRSGLRVFVAAILLCSVLWVGRISDSSSSFLFDYLVWSSPSTLELLVLFTVHFLSLILLIAGLGTIGWIGPLFIFGGVFGILLHALVLHQLISLPFTSLLLGAVALFGGVLNAPLAAGVLAFELTQNIQLLLPALVVGWVGSWVHRRLKVNSFLEHGLRAQGVSLKGGRSLSVLEDISVKEAMVTDFEVIQENESVAELQVRMFRSSYPFFPVVNSAGVYQGMLTLDTLLQIEEGAFLGTFLEAKDLLYREGIKIPVVSIADQLASTVAFFDQVPCVAVVDDDRKLMGLLFVYHVRLAYDREVTRRSSDFVPKDEG